MSFISIDSQKCITCGLCVQSCPVALLKQEDHNLPIVKAEDTENCILCGHCVAVCPKEALTHSLLPEEDFLSVPERTIDAESMESFLISKRSIRGFKKEPVSQEQLQKLIEVARRAPTASNSQNVSWGVISDPNRLDQIRRLTLDWINANRRVGFYAEAEKMGMDVVLRGGTSLVVAYSPEEYNWNMTDSAIALTYMELYASSMQLGTCWAGLVTRASQVIPELREVLGVSEGQIVGGALILGRPKQKHYLIPPRKPANVKWM